MDKIICRVCGLEKDVKEYYKYNYHRCKKCACKYAKKYFEKHKEYQKKYQEKNKEKIRLLRANYRKTKNCRLSNNKSRQRHRKKYPKREIARHWLTRQLIKKELILQPCSVCKSIKSIHGHHNDYNKPEEIIWLCVKHHREWHKNNIPIY